MVHRVSPGYRTTMQAFSLLARSAAGGGKEKSKAPKIQPQDDDEWVTFRLDGKDLTPNAEVDEMELRLQNAAQWEKPKLLEDEMELLQSSLSLEAELAGEVLNEPSVSGRRSKEQAGRQKKTRTENTQRVRIKGFLDFNPYVCSGCGASFQSKAGEEPGYEIQLNITS